MNRLSGIGTCVLKRKGNGDSNGVHCSFRCFGSCRNCEDLFRPTSACSQASNPIANEYKETTDGGRRFVVSLYSLDMNRLSGIGTCVLKRKGNGDLNGATVPSGVLDLAGTAKTCSGLLLPAPRRVTQLPTNIRRRRMEAADSSSPYIRWT
jgi:hypothetical protein